MGTDERIRGKVCGFAGFASAGGKGVVEGAVAEAAYAVPADADHIFAETGHDDEQFFQDFPAT
jgi:hypothetical protein